MAARLDFGERLKIEAFVGAGYGTAEVAERLGRCDRTVRRELSRVGDGPYRADRAQADADRRAARPKAARLVADRVLAESVLAGLGRGWSPAAVSEDLRRRGDSWVCAETIYQAVYAGEAGGLGQDAWKLLTRQRQRRRRRGWRHNTIGPLAGSKTIHQRPPEAENRVALGHWEADLLMCDRNRAAVLVAVERVTRLTLLHPLADRYDSRSVARGLIRVLKPIPPRLRQTLTLDRGGEMSAWRIIEAALSVDVYYCDAKAPQQKGSCEHINGMLRRTQWLPRHLNNHQIRHRTRWVQHQINLMPRKILNNTPALLAYAKTLNQDNHP